jgi:TonB family protein
VVVPGEYTTFDEQQQIAVACHELVHVRRRDWLRTIADEVVRSAFWFHPALWWLLDQIHLTAEQVVDQEVVAITGARQPYLEALVRLAAPVPRMSLRPASLFIRRSHLRERVTLLLKEVSMSRPRLVVSFVTMAVALIVSGRLVVSAFPLEGTVSLQPVQPAQVVQPVVAAQPAQEALPAVESQAPQATKPQGSQRPGEPVPQAVKPPEAGGGSTKIHDVRPVYPPEAAAAGVSGPVILTLTIDSTGQVADAKVVKGDVTLAPAALEAVRQWRYQPPATAPVVATVAVNVVDSQQVDATPQPVRVGGNVKAPVKIKDVKPVYPEVAQNARVQGVVIAEARIDPSGIVSDARILRSIPLLDAAALDALMQWKFVPPLLNGVPVPVIMTVTVNFSLDSTPTTSGAEGGIAGGVVGGVAGGVQGGVAGGVVGGVPGGTGRGAGTGVGAGVAALDAEREVARARQAAGAGAVGEAPVRVGSGIASPKKTKDVRPVYPEVAVAAKVQGVVIAEILIRPDGTVQDAKILRSIPLLDQAALDAVMQWEFAPTLINGEAVPIIMTVTVNFTLAK